MKLSEYKAMRDARIIMRQYENLVETLERQYKEFGYLSHYMLRRIVDREKFFMKDYEKITDTQTKLTEAGKNE